MSQNQAWYFQAFATIKQQLLGPVEHGMKQKNDNRTDNTVYKYLLIYSLYLVGKCILQFIESIVYSIAVDSTVQFNFFADFTCFIKALIDSLKSNQPSVRVFIKWNLDLTSLQRGKVWWIYMSDRDLFLEDAIITQDMQMSRCW